MNLKNKIKSKLKRGSNLENVLRYIYTLLKHPQFLQKKKSFGNKNKDKTIYIIRPNTEDGIQGLMSLFVQVMRKIDYANKKGYISYVDFKNYRTQYYDGKNNCWDYFFTQPSKITIDEAYNSKNVILSGVTLKANEDVTLFKDSIFFDDKLCKYCNDLIWKNIKISDKVNKIVDNEKKKINIEDSIGVYIRGTDYTKLQPTGEYIQPNIEEVIEKISEFEKKYPDSNIFLVTEDKKNYDKLKENFRDKLKIVSYDTFIENYNENKYLSESNCLESNLKSRGEKYLAKIVLLSQCKFLISSITYGSIAAYAINGNKFKEKYIFNKGIYK